MCPKYLESSSLLTKKIKKDEIFGSLGKTSYLCKRINNKPEIDMETARKRTREGVRAAFEDFMREREEERRAAQLRHIMDHPERLADIV